MLGIILITLAIAAAGIWFLTNKGKPLGASKSAPVTENKVASGATTSTKPAKPRASKKVK